MERSQEVAIVIPAYNEEATIAKVIDSVIAYGTPIVVDDCSTDNTAIIARSRGAIVVNHQVNRGYDAALNTGFVQANKLSCKFVVTFDADGQHRSEYIDNIVQQLINGHDLVLTVRPSMPRFAERLFGYYTNMRFGITDPLSGLKGYRIQLFQQLGHFDSYQSIGTELLLFGARQKKSFIQFPVSISARQGSPRFGQKWRANLKILRAIFLSLKPKNRKYSE